MIVFRRKKYIIELKIWRGNAAHEKGIAQLCDYLEKEKLDSGCLLIFDFRKSREATTQEEHIHAKGKNIFAVWV